MSSDDRHRLKGNAGPMPDRPRLRAIDVQRIEHEGSPYLLLRDFRLPSEDAVLVPTALAPYLAMADGTRKLAEIAAAGVVHGAPPVAFNELLVLFGRLDELFLIENGAYVVEAARVLKEYRSAAFRPPALAGAVYPAGLDDLTKALSGYVSANARIGRPEGTSRLAAIISPHIDFARGGPSYKWLWDGALPDLNDVEIAVIFGTDHNGDGPRLTLTHQSYATPWGTLPTDSALVDRLASALAADSSLPSHAFADEAHHIGEHSVELAATWLHHAVGGRPLTMLPILCGSMHRYVSSRARAGQPGPDSFAPIEAAIRILQDVASRRKTVFVAAADFAHVGPAFGDPRPIKNAGRARVQQADAELLESICAGDREEFLAKVRSVRDGYRICGMAPIYMTLWAAGPVRGNWSAYSQCPADDEGGSFVSIAGALLYSTT